MAIFNPQVNPSGLDISNCNGNGIPNSSPLQLPIGPIQKIIIKKKAAEQVYIILYLMDAESMDAESSSNQCTN